MKRKYLFCCLQEAVEMEIMRRKTFIQCQDTPKTHFEHHVLSFKLPYWHSCYKTFNCSKYIYWFKNVYPECFPYFLDLQGIQKKKSALHRAQK